MRDIISKILKEDLSDFSGWVNVKIDNELNKRIEAANAAQNNTRQLDSKIEELRSFFKPRTLA